MISLSIIKTRLYNFDPLKPHFYIVKLGFTGVYIIFLISAQKHRLWVLVGTASSRRFQRVPTICFKQKYEKYQNFLSENFHFTAMKVSVYLNRHVFVMPSPPLTLSTRGKIFSRRHIEIFSYLSQKKRIGVTFHKMSHPAYWNKYHQLVVC